MNETEVDGKQMLHPPAFRLRRGRGGTLRLDRRNPVFAHRRGPAPKLASEFSDWLFPDTFCSKSALRRPRSIDEVDNEDKDETMEDRTKMRRLNEIWRYDAERGGALGVGMGDPEDEDRIVIDDLDPK